MKSEYIGNIILGGFSCADYDYEHRSQYDMVTKNAVPFVVSYNLDKNTVATMTSELNARANK